MRNTKKILSVALSATMIMSGGLVFADNGDYYKAIDKTKHATSDEVLFNINKKGDPVLFTPQNYMYEYDGQLYSMNDANEAFAKVGYDEFQALLKKDYVGIPLSGAPVEGELKVVEVSAINNSTLEIEFNQPVDKDSIGLENFYIGLTKSMANDVETLNPNMYTSSLSKDGKTVTISGINAIATGSPETITTNVIWEDENSDIDQVYTNGGGELNRTETRKFVPMNTDGSKTVLKDRTVYVQLRNIRTADGKLASAMETSFYAVDNTRPEYAKSEYTLEKTTATDITVTFTEPVHLDLNKAKVYVNSTEVANVEYVDNTTTDVRNHKALKITFGSNVELVEGNNKLEIVGLEDFSANTTRPSNLVTNIKVAESTVEAPKVVQINQVHDMAFLVDFDKEIDAAKITVKNLGDINDDAVFTLASGTWTPTHAQAANMLAVGPTPLANGNYRVLVTLDNTNLATDNVMYNQATKAIRDIIVEDYKANSKEGVKYTKTQEFIKDKIAPVVVEGVADGTSANFIFTDAPFNGGIELAADLSTALTKSLVLTHVNDNGRTVKVEVTPTILEANKGDIFALDSVNVPTNTKNVLEIKLDKIAAIAITAGWTQNDIDAINTMMNGTELKAGITITLPYGLVLDDKDTAANVNTPQYDQTPFIGATVNVKGGTHDEVPVVEEGAITYNTTLNAIEFKVNGEDINANTVTNKANYTLDGKSVGIDRIEFTSADMALVYLSQNTIARNGSYDFGVKNIATNSGAKMLPVEANVYLYDNTQPELASAVVRANNKIEVKFNEDIAGAIALIADAEDNFIIEVAGAPYTVKTVTKKDSRTLVLELNDTIDYSKSVRVKLVNTQSNDMVIKDMAGNLAKEGIVPASVNLD